MDRTRRGCSACGPRPPRRRPGKGLTVKQEMRAIKEAIGKRNREFLGKYGGLIQAGERYKELLTLPEAELVKGVSIDGYSTYRATRFSEPV